MLLEGLLISAAVLVVGVLGAWSTIDRDSWHFVFFVLLGAAGFAFGLSWIIVYLVLGS